MTKNLLPAMAKFTNTLFKITYQRICNHLEQEVASFSEDSIQLAYNRVKAYSPNLEAMRPEKNGAHPLTEQIVEKRDLRHTYLLSVRARIKGFVKSPIVEEQLAAKRLHLWMGGFKSYLKNPSINLETQMVKHMMQDLAEDNALQEAAEMLGLPNSLRAIENISNQMQTMHTHREKELRDKVLTSNDVRKEAYKRLRRLRITIETAIELETSDEAELQEYSRIINHAITTVKPEALRGATVRKMATEKETEGVEVEVTPQTEVAARKTENLNNNHATDNATEMEQESAPNNIPIKLIPINEGAGALTKALIKSGESG